MGVAKVTLNGVTQMDVTQKTVEASKMLSGITALKNDGESITGSIASKSSSDLTASGATVTAPAGYYASSASKSVTTATLPTATTTTKPSGTTLLTIDRNTSTRYLSIPAGYETGGYYTISPVANGSVTAPASISGTSATVTTGTNTLTLTKTVSVTPSVTTAGYISSGTAGNSSVSLTASVTTKAATTYNTSSSDQTIASGTYLTGTQTIKAVTTSGISAANIKDGTTIKVGDANDDDRITAVTGTFTDAATVSSGQTAAAAGQLLSGYSAWVDGAEVKGNIPSQAAQTIHPSTNDQTISSSTYLTGTQTIKAVTTTNLTAENIKKDVVVKIGDSSDDDCVTSVTGTMEGEPTWRTPTYDVPSETTTYTANEFGPFTRSTSASAQTSGNTFEMSLQTPKATEIVAGDEYIVSGTIQVVDSSGNVLETCLLSGTIMMPTLPSSAATVYTGDSNSYITTCKIYRNANPYIVLIITTGKNATYGFKYSVTLTATDSYGFSQVTINKGYTEEWLKDYLRRSVTTITWPDNMTSLGDYAFAPCYSFNPPTPPTITTYPPYGFYNCSALYLTSLPDIVISINTYCFYGCTSLALTTLPSALKNIWNYAFYNCSNLALTSLPSSLTGLETYAFYGCTSLALTSIPEGITKIANYVFYGCSNLALTALHSGITSIGQNAFRNCTSLNLTTLPSGLTSIGNSAFQGCTSLTTLSCQGAITSLGTNAFNSWTNMDMQLTSVSFPNLAQTSALGAVFGNSTAAQACHYLAFIDLGNLTSIGSYAFANCYALQTMVLRKTDSVCSLSYTNAFNNTPFNGYNSLTGTVYVPSALIASYQTATNWKTLYNNGTVTFAAIEGSEYEL